MFLRRKISKRSDPVPLDSTGSDFLDGILRGFLDLF